MAKSEYSNFLYQMQLAYSVANASGNYTTLRPWEKFWYYVNVKTDYKLSKNQLCHKSKDIIMEIDEENRWLTFKGKRMKVENCKWFHYIFDVNEELKDEKEQWKDVVYRREHRGQIKNKDKRYNQIIALLDGLDKKLLKKLLGEIKDRLN